MVSVNLLVSVILSIMGGDSYFADNTDDMESASDLKSTEYSRRSLKVQKNEDFMPRCELGYRRKPVVSAVCAAKGNNIARFRKKSPCLHMSMKKYCLHTHIHPFARYISVLPVQ